MMNTILCKRNEKFNMLTQSELELVAKNYREPSLFKFGENFSSLVCYRIAKTRISEKLARQHISFSLSFPSNSCDAILGTCDTSVVRLILENSSGSHNVILAVHKASQCKAGPWEISTNSWRTPHRRMCREWWWGWSCLILHFFPLCLLIKTFVTTIPQESTLINL